MLYTLTNVAIRLANTDPQPADEMRVVEMYARSRIICARHSSSYSNWGKAEDAAHVGRVSDGAIHAGTTSPVCHVGSGRAASGSVVIFS